jgi:hypothetical protein
MSHGHQEVDELAIKSEGNTLKMLKKQLKEFQQIVSSFEHRYNTMVRLHYKLYPQEPIKK